MRREQLDQKKGTTKKNNFFDPFDVQDSFNFDLPKSFSPKNEGFSRFFTSKAEKVQTEEDILSKLSYQPQMMDAQSIEAELLTKLTINSAKKEKKEEKKEEFDMNQFFKQYQKVSQNSKLSSSPKQMMNEDMVLNSLKKNKVKTLEEVEREVSSYNIHF